MNPDQGNRVSGREMDHGIPRDKIIADIGLQNALTVKPVACTLMMSCSVAVLQDATFSINDGLCADECLLSGLKQT